MTPEIPDTTKVLSEDTTEDLVEVSEDGSVFTFAETTPELAELESGDIMVGDMANVVIHQRVGGIV